ncbi:MAG: outer membrane protein assembly factor BamD [Methylococcaceae bacterium]|nr:MAG: outer membrane protein assembly factor BamD [Methylococcaceae bacterium]
MKKTILLILLSAVLPACSLFSDQKDTDQYAGWSADQFYTEAKKSLIEGNYQQAVTLYEKLESRYPFGKYSNQAQMDIAYAYYKNDEPDSAIAAADRFISLNPRNPHVDYAYYLRALTNYNRGISFMDRFLPTDTTQRDPTPAKEAQQQFHELISKFPGSPYSADARQRVVALRNNIAMYEANVAEYYLRRGAYVAAAKRCESIIRDYQRTPAVPVALKMLEDSYRHLELAELADAAAHIYAHNYREGVPLPADVRERTAVEKLWDILGLEKDN